MANWFDIFAFIATASIFVGAIYVVRLVASAISESINSTKESLKSKGVNISSSGVSVRTKSHYSHEDYVDATQRGLIRAMNASAFATSDSIDDLGSSSPGASPPSSGGRPPVSRQGSQASVMTNSSSTGLDSEGKRRRHFGIGKRAKD